MFDTIITEEIRQMSFSCFSGLKNRQLSILVLDLYYVILMITVVSFHRKYEI